MLKYRNSKTCCSVVPANYFYFVPLLAVVWGPLETPNLLSPATLLFFARPKDGEGPFHHTGLATLHCSSSPEVRLALSKPLLPLFEIQAADTANIRFCRLCILSKRRQSDVDCFHLQSCAVSSPQTIFDIWRRASSRRIPCQQTQQPCAGLLSVTQSVQLESHTR